MWADNVAMFESTTATAIMSDNSVRALELCRISFMSAQRPGWGGNRLTVRTR